MKVEDLSWRLSPQYELQEDFGDLSLILSNSLIILSLIEFS